MILRSMLMGALGLGALVASASTLGCASAPPPPAPTPTTAAVAPDPNDDDADDDGVPDAVDKCPDKKENGKGAADKDGCPG